MTGDNLLRDLPDDLPEELVETLLESTSVRIERIVSTGHASPEGFWYDQPQHEFVLVVRGRAHLEFDDGGSLDLEPGGWADIPAHCRHRVAWTSPDEPTVWLAIHF
ncbi:MAG: cupin domain-containing protein [Dehalococcoidia bacterium]|nr:cupin domain-containing protein [Dehalococcoidia bacterium]MYD28429.1 cupin domain-containing protein [Dehalococcoidia bacterium]